MTSIQIGFGTAATVDGRPQIDGAVAFLVDGVVHSLCEERVSRVKHDGNVWRALFAGLDRFGVTIDTVDRFFVSTSGEPTPPAGTDALIRKDSRLGLFALNVDPQKVSWISSHHESHAFEALHSATMVGRLVLPVLILVADRVGQPGEHQSAYLFNGLQLELVWRDCPPSDRLGGFGLVYDRVTRHLGWRENLDAGKTMALAGMAPPDKLGSHTFFAVHNGHLEVLLPADDSAAHRVLESIIPDNHVVTHRFERGALLAGQLQSELESAVLALTNKWCKEYAPQMLLFSGGVATNCKLLGRLARAFPKLVVQGTLAPSDTGQGIGNLVASFFRESGTLLGQAQKHRRPGFWPIQRADVHRMTTDSLVLQRVALALISGAILLVCEGNLEPGPRALGFHSIIADARDPVSVPRLNALVKRRDWFRPYGALITPESAVKFFGTSDLSPFMDLAIPVPKGFADLYPAVVHHDGTSRFQSAGALLAGSFAVDLLRHLSEVHSIEAVINTSLNTADEPMVSGVDRAVAIAKESGLTCLIISDGVEDSDGRWLVQTVLPVPHSNTPHIKASAGAMNDNAY